MPNRTIYVADADVPIFEKAQQLVGGNLSAAIAHALRRLVEAEEAKASGFEEVTVKVGKGRPYMQKQFRGRLIGRRRAHMPGTARMLTLTVYQTAKGRFALYTKNNADWSWSDGSERSHSRSRNRRGRSEEWDESAWAGYGDSDEYRLEVFETLEDLREALPGDFYESIATYLSGGDIEVLDI